jgi:Flp pilus assembly pilin Flp
MAEYALLVTFIALVALAGVILFGEQVLSLFEDIAGAI